MVSSDSGAYNVMIRAFTDNQSPQKAVILFMQILENGVLFDEFSLPCTLKACSQLRGMREGKQVHAQVVKCGFGSDGLCFEVYGNCGDIILARKLFDGMCERDIFTWNSMLSGYVKNGYYEDVIRLRELDVGFKYITFLSVLPACGRLGDVELGEWIHDILITALVDMYSKCGEMDKARNLFDGLDRKNVITWSAMISGYTQSRRCKDALDLFNEMQRVWSTGKWVHVYIERKKIKITLTLGTALIDFYGKCGLMDGAAEVFQNMPQKNVYLWTALIQGFANNGQGRKALEFYQKMRESDIEPNNVTFIGVRSACSHAGLVSEGREFFISMSRDFGIEPSLEHYGCMVDILGRAGLIEEAYHFVKEMPIRPSAVTWRTLLASCKVHKNVEIAEESLKHLVELEPMHSGDDILLSNIYASVGRLSAAMRRRSEMKERGIKKMPGCSLIELEGQIYELAVAKLHPFKAIYNATEDMIRQIKAAGCVPNISDARFDAEEDSEKLAIAFGLSKTPPGTTIRISKKLKSLYRLP
ncbi:hypothetical protein K2173_027458 [Erythroxylum novogranatense]|uniref:Pentatricopeptide repeat-containing protein n=1 Tax=Erythroxylum novogranatense TaxID=1862640 RepID=A0AAV8TZ59_9ROSI|nr:hypothetical protein K2173_027458 [Erythroxylum novogranatense]